jgi:FkbM family methyltransferase
MIGKDLKREMADARKTLSVMRRFHAAGRSLLDCGANVGFVAEAMRKDFARIVAIEAHPTTFGRMQKRLKGSGILTVHAAVRGSTKADLWVSSPKHSTGASVQDTKRRKLKGYYQKVKGISLGDLIKKHKPDVVKLDIEYSEYDAILCSTFKGVKQLFVEYHGLRGERNVIRFKACEEWLKAHGLSRVHPRKIKRMGKVFTNMCFVVVYERD